MSRSLQGILINGRSTITKDDKSPVTIADFAVQALVIDNPQNYTIYSKPDAVYPGTVTTGP
jgi:3'-phosphoadenosine 5'-phosphosulfate (PAPS) 3'-phosphatase